MPSWPAVGIPQVLALMAGAFGIAVISLTDTSVLSQSFAGRFGYEVDADEEFVSLGVANLAVGLFQGFPVSGSSTRTAINQSAGAKSQLAGIVAAVVLGSMLVATPWLLETLPISVLAAVVISAGFELADIAGTARLWKLRRTEFVLSVVSFLGVLALGVLPGVFLAVGLSMLNFIRRQWWPHDAVLGRVTGVKGYHDTSDFAEAEQVPGLLLFRFDAPIFFANAGIFRQRVLDRIKAAPTPVRRFVLCAEPMIDVDTTAADVLGELIDDLRARGIEFALAEVKHPVAEHLERYGLIAKIGPENLYPTIGSAVHAYIHASGVDWIDWQDAEEQLVGADEDSGPLQRRAVARLAERREGPLAEPECAHPDRQGRQHVLRAHCDDQREAGGDDSRRCERVRAAGMHVERARHHERRQCRDRHVLEEPLEPRWVRDVPVQHDRQAAHQPRPDRERHDEYPELRLRAHDASRSAAGRSRHAP